MIIHVYAALATRCRDIIVSLSEVTMTLECFPNDAHIYVGQGLKAFTFQLLHTLCLYYTYMYFNMEKDSVYLLSASSSPNHRPLRQQ